MSVEIWDDRGITDSPPFHCGCCGISFEQVGLELSTDRGSPGSRDAKMYLCLGCADEVTAAAAEIRGRAPALSEDPPRGWVLDGDNLVDQVDDVRLRIDDGALLVSWVDGRGRGLQSVVNVAAVEWMLRRKA